jgi:hypothetical protein
MATDHRPLNQAEERELKALEAGLAGKPVDADLAELAALAADLNAGRPQPDPLFAAELDQAVTDGFPPEWSVGRSRRRRQGFFGRLGSSLGFDRQSFAPLATGLAGLLIVVVAAGIAFEGGGSDGPGGDDVNPQNTVSSADSAQAGAASGAEAVPQAATLDRAIGDGAGSGIEIYPEGRTATAATGVQDREVARNVRITLSTPSEDLQETSNRIVEVSDSYGGIIMRSSISGGDGGGRASFSLLIPSDKAEAAVAELSSVADLRSRTQQSVDITAPTVSAKQRLRTARARVESLLSELSEAPDDEARRQVGRQLYWARQNLSSLTANLERLERQVSFTPVNLAVETSGDSGSDSGWSIGDAVGDAGHLLAVSAGVAVVALAVAIPIGLMVLVALAINRAWLRRSRERALRDD